MREIEGSSSESRAHRSVVCGLSPGLGPVRTAGCSCYDLDNTWMVNREPPPLELYANVVRNTAPVCWLVTERF